MTFQVGASSSTSYLYMFGVAKKMSVSAVVTCIQSVAKLIALSLDVFKSSAYICHSRLPNHIGQTCLPLSFGLIDATSAIHSHV